MFGTSGVPGPLLLFVGHPNQGQRVFVRLRRFKWVKDEVGGEDGWP
jgi:hypothetical protein